APATASTKPLRIWLTADGVGTGVPSGFSAICAPLLQCANDRRTARRRQSQERKGGVSMDEYRHKIFRFWALYATGACTVLDVALEITNGLNALAVVTGAIWCSLFLWNCYYAYQDRRDDDHR